MLNVITDENKIVQDALKGEYDENNISTVLKLLIKHYYIKRVINELELREKILDFLKNNYNDYKRGNWENAVYCLVDRFLKSIKRYKIEPKLIKIEDIRITENELNKIKELNNIKLEKVAFIMLVYGKISKQIIHNGEDIWVNESVSNILKEAKINANKKDKQLLFYELSTKGYIQECNKITKSSFKLNYADKNDKSNVTIIINDFEGVVYQYLIWKGERWKRCENCNNKWFKLKSHNSNQKCCNYCAKEIKNKQNLKLWHKNKQKYKN